MTSSASRSRATWSDAAMRLARRATRRERLGAALPYIGTGLLVGSLPGLLARAAPALSRLAPMAPFFVAAGLLVGGILGMLAARRVAARRPGDAAWALDRLAHAEERGLTAAMVDGPRGAEAAWAAPQLAPPPTVRLLPPRGLAFAAGAALVAGVALVVAHSVPSRTTVPTDAADLLVAGAPTNPAGSPNGRSTMAPAEALDAEAERVQEQARAAEAVAEALGIASDEVPDPQDVAARLKDPQTREKVAEAARGTSLETAIAAAQGDGDKLARTLSAALGPESRAEERRREAVALRALDPRPAVPAHRRELVERYYELEGER